MTCASLPRSTNAPVEPQRHIDHAGTQQVGARTRVGPGQREAHEADHHVDEIEQGRYRERPEEHGSGTLSGPGELVEMGGDAGGRNPPSTPIAANAVAMIIAAP